MIRHVSFTSGTPIQIVRVLRPVNRRIPFIPVAHAIAAASLAAAIVVRDHIVLTVSRVAAGPDPRNVRHDRSRWTACGRASATAAQIAINGAVTPITAAVWITGFGMVVDADAFDPPRNTGSAGRAITPIKVAPKPRKRLRRDINCACRRINFSAVSSSQWTIMSSPNSFPCSCA